MDRKLLGLLMTVFLVVGVTTLTAADVAKPGHGPVITQAFASPQLRPGDTWRVYLNASDPDGEMKYIVCEIFQPGRGQYPVAFTRIARENRKSFSGYIHLNTLAVQNLRDFAIFNLTLHIQGRAGNFGQSVSFPLAFNLSYQQETPPTGVFQDKDLGPIMVNMRGIYDGGNGGRPH